MVFESLLVDLLNKHLGQYVENLDSSQLKVGIWGGNVVLKNLILKHSALDELNLPVKTVYGCLGKLTLQIPWSNLYNAPVMAAIEGLYILAIPNKAMKYDPVKDEKWRQEEKQAELKKIEEAKKKQKEAEKPSQVDPSFVEKLSTQIIKNVELEIRNIHIRFEDSVSCPGKTFAAGITLDSLVVKTIAHFGPELNIDPINLIFKELAISCLSLYWNPVPKNLFTQHVDTNILDLFKNGIITPVNPTHYHYLLGPINALAQLRINSKPELDNSNYMIPKAYLVMDLQTLALSVTKEQFLDIIAVVEAVDYMQRSLKYRKYRPQLSEYKGHAKEWWKFAYNCILEEDIRRRHRNWSWDHIKQHKQRCSEYYVAYKEKLSSPKNEGKSLVCTEIEKELDVLNIVLIRERAELEVERQERESSSNVSTTKGGGGGWLSSWWGGSKTEDKNDEDSFLDKVENVITPEEKKKLFSAIDYSEGELPMVYPKHFVLLANEIRLNSFNIKVLNHSYSKSLIMTFALNNANVKVNQRQNGLSIVTAVKSFTVSGSEQGNYVPKIVQTAIKESEKKTHANNLLEVLFEMSPLDNENVDKRIRVNAEPLQIIYDGVTINRFVEVFSTEKPIEASGLQAAVQTKIVQFKQMSAIGVQQMIENHETLEVDIVLKASSIIVPKKGILDTLNQPRLIISLGDIKMNSLEKDRTAFRHNVLQSVETAHKKLEEQSYDSFLVKLTDLQVVFALAEENIEALTSEMYFLKPSNLTIEIRKCIIPDDPRLPLLKVNGQLDGIHFTVSDVRLQELLELLQTAFPTSETGSLVQEVPSLTSRPYGSVSSIASTAPIKPRTKIDKTKIVEVIQLTQAEINFALQEVRATLSDAKGTFIDFTLNTLGICVLAQTYNQKIALKLSGVQMIQYYMGEPIKVVSTNESADKDYLFSIDYIKVEKNSPEFHVKYGSVLQTIKVDFTTLDVYMHCEALLELIAKMNVIFASETTKDEATPEPKLSTARSISEYPRTSIALGSKPKSVIFVETTRGKKGNLKSDVIGLKVDVLVGNISMTLANKKEAILNFRVTGGEAGVTLRKAYTILYAQLNGIELIDFNRASMYSKVISLVDETEAAKAKIVIFNTEERAAGSVDMSLKASISQLRFIFLKSFIDRVLNFMNNFQEAQNAVLEASQAAAEAAKQNVQEAYENATRIELQFNLDAPIVIVPINATSRESFILDFGYLTAENTFLEIPTSATLEPAVLDRIKVDLTNLKLSRVILNRDFTFEKEYKMIEPVTFKLTLQRNLSSGWFTDIPDTEIACTIPSITVHVTNSDYVMMMRMLDENLGSTPPVESSKTPGSSKAHSDVYGAFSSSQVRKMSWHAHQDEGLSKEEVLRTPSVHEKTRMSMKFLCNIDDIVVGIGDPTDESGEKELAKVTLHVISVKGSMLSDGSLQFSLILLDLIIDDTRPSQGNKINRYMERKKEVDTTAIITRLSDGKADSISSEQQQAKGMVDIVYQQNKNVLFANVRICSFTLILNVEHLTKVASVFTLPNNIGKAKPILVASGTDLKHPKPVQDATKTLLTFNFKCEHPDIILVEHMDDINTNALIMHCEIQLKSRMSGSQQSVSGSINDLQLFSCCYSPEKRKSTKQPVLYPFSLILAGTTPEGSGLHVDLGTTEIKLSVTPGTIQLLNNISTAITGGEVLELEDSSILIDRSDMWNIQTFEDTEYYFLKTDLATEADADSFYNRMTEETVLSELCVFSVPSIIITLDTGVGATTTPVLLLESSIKANIKNWSSLINIDSTIEIQVSYFNHTLGLWEPILEPVETQKEENVFEFCPWSLSIQVETNKIGSALAIDNELKSDMTDINKCKPATSVQISSKEVMPITITKTCLDVLKQLSNEFSDAIYKPMESTGVKSQYLVKNDTGLSLTVNLEGSDFMLWGANVEQVNEVVLDPGAKLELIAQGASVVTSRNELITRQLNIKIASLNSDLHLPISRMDKRYFSLNYRGSGGMDNWGLVSDVDIRNGCTAVTLRSIIQVINHFSIPVSIYYMTKKGNEVSFIGSVKPLEKLNLPLEAIYTPTSELFFSIEGYSVSVVPFIWKDLQLSLEKTMMMKCNPKNIEDKDPFFFKAQGEMEQIYFENTTMHTMISSCYNIHIRPTVIFKNLLPINVLITLQGDIESNAHPLTIDPGNNIQIPTAEPGHSSVIVKIPEYLDREWCCKHEIEENAPELAVWTFESYEAVPRVTLELGVHTSEAHSTVIMELYCPFWMLNKTGLMLSYKEEHGNNVLYHPVNFTGPILFSFKAKNFFAKKKSQLRVDNGQWSEKFSLDVAGSAGSISCVTKDKIYNIGIAIQLTYSTLTKQAVFTPFFVVINNWSLPMEFQEIETNEWLMVKEKDCCPFWPLNKTNHNIRVRQAGTTETTTFFPYRIVHNTVLRLNNKLGAINVDVQVSDGATHISFFPYEYGMAPALIMNHMNMPVELYDKSQEHEIIKLAKNEQVLFTWHHVEEEHHLVLNSKLPISIREDGIGTFSIHETICYWTSFLYGLQRVLLFTEDKSIASDAQNIGEFDNILQELELAISGIGVSLVDNIARVEVLHMGIASSGLEWLSKKKHKRRYKALSERESQVIEAAYQRYLSILATGKKTDPQVIIDNRITVDFVLFEMLKPTQRQLKRTYKNGLWMNFKKSQHLFQMHAKINRIQIDNQMFDCVFPVVLAPIPPPKTITFHPDDKPFIEVSIVKRVNEYSVVQQYKYFKVLVQEFEVKVDIGFLNAMSSMFQENEDYNRELEILNFKKDMELKDEPLQFHVIMKSLRDQKHFYDYLHLSPIKIHVSFTLSSGGTNVDKTQSTSQENKASTPQVIHLLMQSLGVTLTDVQGVIFKLGYFEREYCFLTQTQLMNEVKMHYVSQLVKQLYVLVFGLDVIGNPFGLVIGLGHGAVDLFYEPFQGAIQGPGEFATGLVYGFRSLLGHTVGGAAGAVSKITGAMGKGLAALTFDKEYQRHRREMVGHQPANFQEGIAQSGKGLVMGVVDGITGVIRQPISGARDDGVGGFCKGVGKGLVGLVTRPIAGLTDFASGSFNAVKRATDLSEEVLRMRSPRCIQADGLIKPFSKREAEGLKLLMSVDKGKYSKTDMYVYHVPIGQAKQKDVLLLTDKRIAYVSINEIFGGYQMDWSYKWTDIQPPAEIIDKGVVFNFGKKKGVKHLFQATEMGKLLLINQEDVKKTVVNLINQLIIKNATRTSASPPQT